MLISALCDYCDVLEQRGVLPQEGYTELGISYLISLAENGCLESIIDIREKSEKNVKNKIKMVYTPRKCMLPERPRSTSVSAHFVEVRGSYIFGLQYRKNRQTGEEILSTEADEKTEEKRKKIIKQHQSFVREVQEDFKKIKCPSELVKAYINFADSWRPEKETNNKFLLAIGKDLNTAKFGFCFAGHPEKMLQDDKEVRIRWNEINNRTENEDVAQCAITGNVLPVARIHDALVSGKGIGVKNAGTNPSLVNFKPESFLSYGHLQGSNACISTLAMKKYTKALNWLLSDPGHHNYLDGLTLVYWTSGAEKSENDPLHMLLDGNAGQTSLQDMDMNLSTAAKDAENAAVSETRVCYIEKNAGTDTYYYVLALVPNSSRIQLKFLYRQKLGKVFDNIARYQKDLRIVGQKRAVIPLWKLKKELVPPESSHPEVIDAMFLSVLESILKGSKYPVWLLSAVINRIRKDRDETDSSTGKKKRERINDVRAGIVKACIIRYSGEEMTVALDRDNTNQAYLCGRLFAMLQKIQEDSAAPAKLNRTIEDAYFSAASTNPASVLPKLVRLSRHHMTKLRKNHPDWAVNDSKQINEIISMLGTSFPETLGLYDQGRFILGYYHQNAARFESKKGDTKNA